MDLVLNEEVHHGHNGAKEAASNVFPVSDCRRVGRAQCQATKHPGNSRDQVRDHKDVVPVMVVGRSDVGPATACQGSEDAPERNEAGKSTGRRSGEEIPQPNEGEPGPYLRQSAQCFPWRRG